MTCPRRRRRRRSFASVAASAARGWAWPRSTAAAAAPCSARRTATPRCTAAPTTTRPRRRPACCRSPSCPRSSRVPAAGRFVQVHNDITKCLSGPCLGYPAHVRNSNYENFRQPFATNGYLSKNPKFHLPEKYLINCSNSRKEDLKIHGSWGVADVHDRLSGTLIKELQFHYKQVFRIMKTRWVTWVIPGHLHFLFWKARWINETK